MCLPGLAREALAGVMLNPRKLSADAVCAYAWATMTEHQRAALCALAKAAETCAILEWYELEAPERAALRVEIGDLIAASDERQRRTWAEQFEKMKRFGMIKTNQAPGRGGVI